MQYQEAVSYVHSLLRFGVKPGLERMRAMMEALGNPQDRLRFAHVAGTNGKGSTCVMLAEILCASGYKTGLFTSPYVIEFRERMQVNGEMIPQDTFAALIEQIRPVADRLAAQGMQPTEFEVITAAAFLYFEQEKCDIVVLEVGLGGRLDSTNIIKTPLVSVITSVSMDHMNVLGDTLEEIAAEKCGIIKRGGITVSYPGQDARVFRIVYRTALMQSNVLITQNMGDIRIVAEKITGTDIIYNGLHIHIPLIGAHQVSNCMTAILAAEALRSRGLRRITGKTIVSGVAAVRMPARLEVFQTQPLLLLDGGHNADGLHRLAEALRQYLPGRRIVAVIGMMADKAYDAAAREIAPLCAEIIATTPSNPRALPARQLAQALRAGCGRTRAVESPEEAVSQALHAAQPEDVLLVCGSFYLASDVRTALLQKDI
ncbi:MAG TPA: bifunctional folylpolyglutamate synthase/dihydrofolate synthase [Candidatus Fimivicinus intestinavium]|nr:bifunctional folylpolyglutamate synthase/dihydrofolate synthase [Candidatus Fimivicinus intestinavium]